MSFWWSNKKISPTNHSEIKSIKYEIWKTRLNLWLIFFSIYPKYSLNVPKRVNIQWKTSGAGNFKHLSTISRLSWSRRFKVLKEPIKTSLCLVLISRKSIYWSLEESMGNLCFSTSSFVSVKSTQVFPICSIFEFELIEFWSFMLSDSFPSSSTSVLNITELGYWLGCFGFRSVARCARPSNKIFLAERVNNLFIRPCLLNVWMIDLIEEDF